MDGCLGSRGSASGPHPVPASPGHDRGTRGAPDAEPYLAQLLHPSVIHAELTRIESREVAQLLGRIQGAGRHGRQCDSRSSSALARADHRPGPTEPHSVGPGPAVGAPRERARPIRALVAQDRIPESALAQVSSNFELKCDHLFESSAQQVEQRQGMPAETV